MCIAKVFKVSRLFVVMPVSEGDHDCNGVEDEHTNVLFIGKHDQVAVLNKNRKRTTEQCYGLMIDMADSNL